MTSQNAGLLNFFRLKPVRTARVSDISETTAASPVAEDERVNFHIGNPLQDSKLSSAFLRIALGVDAQQETLHDAASDAILEYLGWNVSEKPRLEFLISTIQKSNPYMPRGGYVRKNPHALIREFCKWLESQAEPLHYDTGEQTGRREMILASGGVQEALRIFLFVISEYMEKAPVQVFLYRFELLEKLKSIANVAIETLDSSEINAREQLQAFCEQNKDVPLFLILGEILTEETRRTLRAMSLKYPIFFIEINNAPNHLSLAREAKLVERVIRFLTPAIFSDHLKNVSIVFIVGNSDFLNVIENVHFNLKGTPSASEVELLIYLLEHGKKYLQPPQEIQRIEIKPSYEGLEFSKAAELRIPIIAESIEQKSSTLLDSFGQKVEHSLSLYTSKTSELTKKIRNVLKNQLYDEFASLDAQSILEEFFSNLHDSEWIEILQKNFLSVFVKHQSQYDRSSCMVVSGSSRTALGILGFHCGIYEVVIPDLSWSYEQCFPIVHAVPLTSNLELNVDAIKVKIEELCRNDAEWKKRGALVLNNPHNATGQTFSEETIKTLVKYCLQNSITIIDDLSYQNVVASPELPIIKTVRQIEIELRQAGIITEEQSKKVVTVHSMSKTDCLAGARLAVIEIRDEELHKIFQEFNTRIQPNINAVLICYLFYRNNLDSVRAYWRLRNSLFYERVQSLLNAANQLPAERNIFNIAIIPPTGSMYPLLRIELLPSGLSLDWLASNLARRGIGMLPLATFARSEEGYETGRTTFRLTLGGKDGAETLLLKTRYVLIHLNRLIKDEAAQYNRKYISLRYIKTDATKGQELSKLWQANTQKIIRHLDNNGAYNNLLNLFPKDIKFARRELIEQYIPSRLELLEKRLLDRALLQEELVAQTAADNGKKLAEKLEREFMKDSLERRMHQFRLRTHDRTVHPTQMFSLKAEIKLDELITKFLYNHEISSKQIEEITYELFAEYLGVSVPISSRDEADEILLDLNTIVRGETFADLFSDSQIHTLLSFWSDWDGSNRPSGQGHRLVATVVMENVSKLAQIFSLLYKADPEIKIDRELVAELERLPQQSNRFTRLLNDITLLTHQLERRYRGILPFALTLTPTQKLITKWHLRKDPIKALWQHNDKFERKMLELRTQRRQMLEFYFRLNKRLRKQLNALIPELIANRTSRELLNELVAYKDKLQRTIITPRIQQGMITARDQFAVDTTVYNIFEINAISGSYGNPGMALAMQISLSTEPEACILLERKLRSRWEQTRREYSTIELPKIWLIPLFEDINSVHKIGSYIEHVWNYASQSSRSDQSIQERFAEIICEVFIAGSDLSQQIGQAAAATAFLKAKYDLQVWLANHGITEEVRIKLGSGEPMQRQGGYYSNVAGNLAFNFSNESKKRFEQNLPPATRKSVNHAVTPLLGIFKGGDLRTFQSNLSEHLRFLPVHDFVDLLYHVKESQNNHRNDLIRAAESIVETRLQKKNKTSQELERLAGGTTNQFYDDFLKVLIENFRQILYGREEDVVGIHAISYFIGRSIPQLRDRPTSRPVVGVSAERGQRILERIAETIPFAKHGSLLRAISHNQAQTVILGINQLTTGLFRALQRFTEKTLAPAEQESMIAEHIFPRLPVYEILNTLRLYQDYAGKYLKQMESAFLAGNSAFVMIREDLDAMHRYIPLLQKELVRQHGLNVNDFFNDGVFLSNLLPTLRPDLAVLLQKNLFNTSYEELVKGISGDVSLEWELGIKKQLKIPLKICYWREKIWDIIGESVYQRVQSFTELATALYAFSSHRSFESPKGGRERKLSPALAEFFRTAHAEDEMRNFLVGAIEYLSLFTEGNVEAPVSIVRAINDVERLAQIEEHALPIQKQNAVRFYVLQIGRLAGENG